MLKALSRLMHANYETAECRIVPAVCTCIILSIDLIAGALRFGRSRYTTAFLLT